MLPIMPMKDEKIILAHGAGGTHSKNLIENFILKYFDNPILRPLPDSATLKIDSSIICFTTDSFVVNPLFFPGGDIGKLAVCGTINDLAVAGAKPLFLSCSFVIEEGFKVSNLEKILSSMALTAKKAGVRIITGDTKVVEKGKCDGLFINTSGIGIKEFDGVPQGIEKIKPEDAIILSGVPGMHELAVVCARGNFNLKTKSIKSDCAPINSLVHSILKTSNNIRFMRDPTRGGLAATLNEIVAAGDFGLKIYEEKIPLNNSVRSLCEILGYDIMNLASEGRVVIISDSEDAEKIVRTMKKHPLGKNSKIIGYVTDEFSKKVVMRTAGGSERLIRMPSGMQLPRIC